MSLVKQRNEWREQIESGDFEVHNAYSIYKENRNSELWRSTAQLERIFEYIMYLEEKLNGTR